MIKPGYISVRLMKIYPIMLKIVAYFLNGIKSFLIIYLVMH